MTINLPTLYRKMEYDEESCYEEISIKDIILLCNETELETIKNLILEKDNEKN